MDDDTRIRQDRLWKRLMHPGLQGDHWLAVAREWQRLADADPVAANAHVLDFWAAVRQRNAGRIDGVPRLKIVPQHIERARVVGLLEVDNPDITPGLRDGKARGENQATERQEQPVNLCELVGGFARCAQTREQTLAAGRFRLLYERVHLGAVKANDIVVIHVDGGGGDDVTAGREDARRAYKAATGALGEDHGLVERIVCEDRSIREVARVLFGGDGGAAQERVRDRLTAAVDRLVSHFGLSVAAGRARLRASREAGAVPTVFTGNVLFDGKLVVVF